MAFIKKSERPLEESEKEEVADTDKKGKIVRKRRKRMTSWSRRNETAEVYQK